MRLGRGLPVLWVVVGLLVWASAARESCILLGGSCLHDAKLDVLCANGDPRGNYECPGGSTCCLPLGALCEASHGQCRSPSNCRNGRLVDYDFVCAGNDVCCVDRDAPRDLTMTNPPARLLKPLPKRGGNTPIHHQEGAAVPETEIPGVSGDLWLSIFLPIVIFAILGLTAFLVARQRRKRGK